MAGRNNKAPKKNRNAMKICNYKNYSCFFCGTSGSATIKHRCVTHLCGWNAIQHVMSNEF